MLTEREHTRPLFFVQRGDMDKSPVDTGKGLGLIAVASNEDIDRQRTAESEQYAEKKPEEVTTGLAGFVRVAWERAARAKVDIETRMLRCKRAVAGEYETDKLAAIRLMGGSEVFLRVTATKCRDAESWVKDILKPTGADRTWEIEPTPIADLPREYDDYAKQKVIQESLNLAVTSLMQTGQPLDPTAFADYMEESYEASLIQIRKRLQDKAEKVCERMGQKINDQLVEGGWYTAFNDALSDVIRNLAGIVKGPVIMKKKSLKWTEETEEYKPILVDEFIPCWYRVDPFDLYPGPDTTTPEDGYLIEKHRFSRNDIAAMLGVPGFKDEEIRAVLEEYGKGGLREWTVIEPERAEIESRTTSLYDFDKIDALEYTGPVQGRLLFEYGLDTADVPDPDVDYEVNVWLVGTHVIKATIATFGGSDSLYHITSFEKVPGSFWGRGIPEIMEDVQGMANAVARAMINNVAIASGPIVEVNVDRLASGQNVDSIVPWMVIRSTNSQMVESPAVKYYQPTMKVMELQQTLQAVKKEADDVTGVPAYSHGDPNVGGAGNTASGLSMLFTAAARGIKNVVALIDGDIVKPCIETIYKFNMSFVDDPLIKGDAKVKVLGATAIVAKEQQAIRRKEILDSTNNPADLQIMGASGRAYLLGEAFRAAEIDPDKAIPNRELLPDPDVFAMMQMGGGMMPGGMPGAMPGLVGQPDNPEGDMGAPQQMDAAGNKRQGEDTKLVHGRP